MLNVFFTVDVEVWCGGWDRLDERFPEAFERYIYGRTARGDFGLPYQLQLLSEHGFTGVFFVEPLFATRFGVGPLAEIAGLISNAKQEIALHLHTEWVNEAISPILPGNQRKRQHLRYFDADEQQVVVQKGVDLLRSVGVRSIPAFRAGSFAFDARTLPVLAKVGIPVDSSYNAAQFGLDSGVMPGVAVVEPMMCDGVIEYPMSVFDDGIRGLRMAQLTACSSSEFENLLWRAAEEKREAVVILSHNFELLNRSLTRADQTVITRLRRLLSFLDRHRDSFHVGGFEGVVPRLASAQPPVLRSSILRTGLRMMEQASRWRYR